MRNALSGRVFGVGVMVARWYFAIAFLIAGLYGLWTSIHVFGQGDSRGIYVLIGGASFVVLGWLVHPWGLTRRSTKK